MFDVQFTVRIERKEKPKQEEKQPAIGFPVETEDDDGRG